MAIRATSEGLIPVPEWNSFIGVDVISVFKELDRKCHCIRINDSIGINGLRHLTMTNSIWRIELICESKEAEKVLTNHIAPSETDWQVIDIFVYHKRKDKPDFPYK